MIRLHMTVEGQTEQAFCTQLLSPHLAQFEVYLQKPRLCGLHQRRNGRIPHGGLLHTFHHTYEDIKRWLREDSRPDARFSMMVDLYGLPADFPGFSHAQPISDPLSKAKQLEESLANAINDPRFIPYLSVHEFEALILADPERIHDFFPTADAAIARLMGECERYQTPEHVNDGQHSHPKARLKRHILDYQENIDGPNLTQRIGLPLIRAKCQHFHSWLSLLENLNDGANLTEPTPAY